MSVPDWTPNRRNSTFLFSPLPPSVLSLKPSNSGEFAVSTRLRRSLRKSMLKPSRRRSTKLSSFKKNLTSMSLSTESQRETTWLSTSVNNYPVSPSPLMDGCNPTDLGA